MSKTHHAFNVSLENYIKTLWNLSYKKNSSSSAGVRNSELASVLGVTRPSVTGMLQKLEKLGYVKKVPKSTQVRLTDNGKELAIEILRKHRLIEMFLHKTLKLDGLELHHEAELLEHAVSQSLMEKIDEFLGYPKQDFSGVKIPALYDLKHDDFMAQSIPLSELKNSKPAKIVSLPDYDLDILKRCLQKGLQIGLKLQMIENDTPNFVQFGTNKGSVTLSAQDSGLIRVIPL